MWSNTVEVNRPWIKQKKTSFLGMLKQWEILQNPFWVLVIFSDFWSVLEVHLMTTLTYHYNFSDFKTPWKYSLVNSPKKTERLGLKNFFSLCCFVHVSRERIALAGKERTKVLYSWVTCFSIKHSVNKLNVKPLRTGLIPWSNRTNTPYF